MVIWVMLLSAIVNSAVRNIGINLFVWILCFQFFWVYAVEWNWRSHVLTFEEPPSWFPQQLYHFTLPETIDEGSNVATSSPHWTLFPFLLSSTAILVGMGSGKFSSGFQFAFLMTNDINPFSCACLVICKVWISDTPLPNYLPSWITQIF